MKYHNKSSTTSLSALSFKLSAFTLVELIIVITILAILATIAFVSFKGYLTNTRDSNRITTIKNIDEGLAIYQVSTGLYPKPEGDTIYSGSLDLSGSIVSYSYLGVIGDNISKQIKINPTPLDPLSNTNYIYATTTNYNKYQIATVLENLDASINLTNEVYANESSYKAKVLGNHNPIAKVSTGSKTYFTTIPSMLFAGTGNVLNSTSSYPIINGGRNLPYRLNAKEETTKQSADEVMKELRNDDNAKIITIDITSIVNGVKTPEEVFGTGTTEESKELLASMGVSSSKEIQSLITGGVIAGSQKSVNYSNCSLSGETIKHGQRVTAYSETSILWNASYDCASKSQLRICNNGELDGNSNYKYTNCIKGEPTNCSANASYTNSGHTYSIPAINHSQTTTNILSSAVNENNGTFKYTLTSIECNDGVLINPQENTTPTLQSCNSGYYLSGSNCIAYVNGACSGAPANAVYSNNTASYSLSGATNGTSLTASYNATPTTNTCQFKCGVGAIWLNNTCEIPLYSFYSHIFTNCGASGRTGPTLANCRSSYSTTWDEDNSFFNQGSYQGYQLWTVPETGTYKIIAKGAKGKDGNYTAGYGAIIKGDIMLTKGEKIIITIGQAGLGNGGSHGNENGGGGGSFVVKQTGNTPLIIAGGGGGSPASSYGTSCSRDQSSQANASTNNSGVNLSCNGTTIYGGTSGAGGQSYGYAGAGGGFNGSGGNGSAHCSTNYGGGGFNNGLVGGLNGSCYTSNSDGGFGGGGAGGLGGPGAGGGYGGGASYGSWSSYSTYGGGGGSYNAGTNQSNTVGNTGDGSVTISKGGQTSCPAGYILNSGFCEFDEKNRTVEFTGIRMDGGGGGMLVAKCPSGYYVSSMTAYYMMGNSRNWDRIIMHNFDLWNSSNARVTQHAGSYDYSNSNRSNYWNSRGYNGVYKKIGSLTNTNASATAVSYDIGSWGGNNWSNGRNVSTYTWSPSSFSYDSDGSGIVKGGSTTTSNWNWTTGDKIKMDVVCRK